MTSADRPLKTVDGQPERCRSAGTLQFAEAALVSERLVVQYLSMKQSQRDYATRL